MEGESLLDSHEACKAATRDEGRCSRCNADLHLTRGDRQILDFYNLVRDQVSDLGLSKRTKKTIWVPRLEAWLAASELYGVPVEKRAEIIGECRFLFNQIQDPNHEITADALDLNALDLSPPELED